MKSPHLSNNLPTKTCAAIAAEPKTKSSLIRNWTVHNLISHPLSEAAYWICRPFGVSLAEKVSGAIHDCTVPFHKPGTGRG